MLPLLAGAASLAGSLAAALPTAANKNNGQKIRELRRKPGLDPAEKDQMYQAQMAPARQVTTQLGNAYAGAAGRGNNSTADLARIRQETATAVGAAAGTAGDRVQQADSKRRLENQAELEQRLAARAQKTSDIIGGIGGAVTDIAEVDGKMKGEAPFDIYGKGTENKGLLQQAGQALDGLAKGAGGGKARAASAAAPIAAPDVNALPEEVTDDDLAKIEAGMYDNVKKAGPQNRGFSRPMGRAR